MIDDEAARRSHRPPVLLECLAKARGVVVLDEICDLLGRERRIQLGARRCARGPLLGQDLLADGQDLVAARRQLAETDDLLELFGPGPPLCRRLRQHLVPEPRGVLLERLSRAGHRGLQPRDEWVGTALRASCSQDDVQEGWKRCAALQVDLDPQLHGVGQARLRLAQQARGGLQPIGDAFEPVGKRGVIPGKEREEGVTDLLGGIAASGPRPSLGQLVELESRLVNEQVSVQRVRRGQIVHHEPVHLGQDRAPEVDALVDRLAGGAGQAIVVLVHADEAGERRFQAKAIAEPAVDGALEAGVRVGGGERHARSKASKPRRRARWCTREPSPTIRGRWPPPRSAGRALASDAAHPP